MTFKLEPGINKCSNSQYHSDKTRLSSSDFKLILKSPEEFKNKVPDTEDKPYFVEGSYVHTLILEPHLIDVEYAIYEGNYRRGKAFDEFKTANPGKDIITQAQVDRCLQYHQQYLDLAGRAHLIKGGESEHTIAGNYANIPVKVRCDYINIDQGYIVDVKTSSFPVDHLGFSETVEKYRYDLSAALYLEITEAYYKKKFDFYFLCIGKRDGQAHLYKLSDWSREVGKASLDKAALIYKNCLTTGNWSDKLVEDYEILEI